MTIRLASFIQSSTGRNSSIVAFSIHSTFVTWPVFRLIVTLSGTLYAVFSTISPSFRLFRRLTGGGLRDYNSISQAATAPRPLYAA